jgi:hypothetical protein
MDARIKSGHDDCVSEGEVEDRFTRTPTFNFQTAASSLRAQRSNPSISAKKEKNGLLRFARNDVQSRRRHSGMVRRTRPGISRFRVRCLASPRNDDVCSNSKHDFTPRDAMRPSLAKIFRPTKGVGNAGCPLHPRSRVHLVVVKRTRVTTSTPESPGIPARDGFNGFLRALPGDRAVLPPSPADMSCLNSVGPTQLRELDASVGASGPHDFAVRSSIVRQLAV